MQKKLQNLILASLIDDDQDVASKKSSKVKRQPNYFGHVNSKFESLFADQIGAKNDDSELKRKTIEESISRVSGITRKKYLTTLRDTMCKYVYYLPFLMECRDLGVEPFAVAQNIIILNRHAKVSKNGLTHVFGQRLDLLKDVIFTEAELAEAKFSAIENTVTETQKTQLSTLIRNAMSILPASSEA